MSDSPLEELERLNERVITEWEQTQLRNALWKHRTALLSAAREAEELKAEIAQYDAARIWLNEQLDEVRRKGAGGDTYRQLVRGISNRLDAAIDSARGAT